MEVFYFIRYNLDMDRITKKLFEAAKKARLNAHAPYSNFKVGAAVWTENGRMFSGCNVESATYTLTTHAEMNAIDSAVAAGDKKIKKILIVTANSEPAVPCALCRQKIVEFSDNAEVFYTNVRGDLKVSTINELYPLAFTQKQLKKKN
jgi:cytidine deaminase